MDLPIIGADYSFSRPGGAALKRAGVKAVGRYLGGTTKGLWNPEIADLKANGIAIWLVYEPGDPGQMAKGYEQGKADARAAQGILNGLDLPSNLPIYSACDFDAVGAGKLSAVMDYQRGWLEVLGYNRSGIYGGGDVLAAAYEHNLAIFFWQAAGWAGSASTVQVESEGGSRRRWSGTTIYQVFGNVMVGGTDKCIIYSNDYGQLPAGETFDEGENDMKSTDSYTVKDLDGKEVEYNLESFTQFTLQNLEQIKRDVRNVPQSVLAGFTAPSNVDGKPANIFGLANADLAEAVAQGDRLEKLEATLGKIAAALKIEV